MPDDNLVNEDSTMPDDNWEDWWMRIYQLSSGICRILIHQSSQLSSGIVPYPHSMPVFSVVMRMAIVTTVRPMPGHNLWMYGTMPNDNWEDLTTQLCPGIVPYPHSPESSQLSSGIVQYPHSPVFSVVIWHSAVSSFTSLLSCHLVNEDTALFQGTTSAVSSFTSLLSCHLA